jgi:hypothetical protein
MHSQNIVSAVSARGIRFWGVCEFDSLLDRSIGRLSPQATTLTEITCPSFGFWVPAKKTIGFDKAAERCAEANISAGNQGLYAI